MKVLLGIGFMVVAYLIDGLALKLLWNWFMVPILGLPNLSLVQSIGISIVVGFLTQQHIPRDKDQQQELIIYLILTPVMAVIIGYIVHLFM